MKTILIVDDAKETAEVLSVILKMNGYHVVCAANGEEGLQKVREATPDLIMLDYMMPTMNGADMAEALRRDEDSACVKILMHSCLTESAISTKFADYDAFLRKPYDVDVALKLIQDLIESEPRR